VSFSADGIGTRSEVSGLDLPRAAEEAPRSTAARRGALVCLRH